MSEEHFCSQVDGVMPGPPCDGDIVITTREEADEAAQRVLSNYLVQSDATARFTTEQAEELQERFAEAWPEILEGCRFATPRDPGPHEFEYDGRYGCSVCGERYHCAACDQGSGQHGHYVRDSRGGEDPWFFSCQDPERHRASIEAMR